MVAIIMEPSTKNGKPNPPKLYRKPPIAGPKLRPKPTDVSTMLCLMITENNNNFLFILTMLLTNAVPILSGNSSIKIVYVAVEKAVAPIASNILTRKQNMVNSFKSSILSSRPNRILAVPATKTPIISVNFDPISGMITLNTGLKIIRTSAYTLNMSPFTDSRIPLLAAAIGKNGAMIAIANIEVKLINDKQIRIKC